MDTTFLVAVFAVFLVSIIFSMFGQGGGSLYTPILVLLGYATVVSISTSLVLNLITALSAAIIYYRANLIDLRLAVAFIPGICIGAFLGGVMTNFVNPAILLWLFVLFLAGAGSRMLYTYWEKAPAEEACPFHFSRIMYAVIVVFSFAVGIISGLLGVGGGTIIIPFLIFLCRYPTKNSAGTVSFIVIFSSLFGVIGHSAFGTLDLGLIAVTAVAVFIGAGIGARYMVRIQPKYIKAGFGIVLWAFAVQLIIKPDWLKGKSRGKGFSQPLHHISFLDNPCGEDKTGSNTDEHTDISKRGENR